MHFHVRFPHAVFLLGLALSALCARATASRGDSAGLEALRRNVIREMVEEGSPSDAARARRHLATLGKDGLWPDVDYADTTPGPWKTDAHLTRLTLMARALRAPNSPVKGDKALQAGALRALEAWLQRDPQNPNWWHNQINVPRLIGETVLLLGDVISPDTRQKALATLSRSDWTTKVGARNVAWTGANLVDMAENRMMRGLIAEDAGMVRDAFDRTYGEIRVVPPGEEGIQRDMSFHQHNSLLYNGGYGEVFLRAITRMMRAARGTPFAIPEDRRDLLARHILDGTQWMMRGRRFDYGTLGRGISRANRHAGAFADVLELYEDVAGPRAAEVREFARRLRGGNVQPLSGNRHFWNSDFMVHHRPGWYASARGYSARLFNTDGAHNNEGRTSHHIADGANFLHRSGEEYHDIFPVWDWRKIPGATVVQDPAPLDVKTMLRKGATTFVGGVSDGRYGMAAMDLQRDGLRAGKAWFFFDDEYICLGTGITDTTGHPVATTVDQRLARGTVRASGRQEPVAGVQHALASRWVLHDGVGYLFPAGAPVRLEREPRRGRWADIGVGAETLLKKDVFTLWLDHGPKPAGATYEYTVIPQATARALDGRLRNDPVVTLANTPDLQAVRHTGLGIVQAAFRTAGGVPAGEGWTVRVDQPCLIMARRAGAGWNISVANPENKPMVVNVTLQNGSVSNTLRFDLPDGPDAGRSVEASWTPALPKP